MPVPRNARKQVRKIRKRLKKTGPLGNKGPAKGRLAKGIRSVGRPGGKPKKPLVSSLPGANRPRGGPKAPGSATTRGPGRKKVVARKPKRRVVRKRG